MKKKSLVPSTLVGWGVAVLALLVVVFIFFGPKQLFAKTTDNAFSFGSGVLPDQEAPNLKGQVQIPPDLENEFDSLVRNINDASATDSCLVGISELQSLEDNENWCIKLSNNKAEIFRDCDKPIPISMKSADLSNFNPCTIDDQNSVLNFYDRYLSTEMPKIPRAISPPLKDIILDKDNHYEYLYKTGNQFCTFKFDDGHDCTRPNAPNVLIDSVCKNKMPLFESDLLLCRDKASPNVQQSTDAQIITSAIKSGIDSSAVKCLVGYNPLILAGWRLGIVQDENNIKFFKVFDGNNVVKIDTTIQAKLCLISDHAATELHNAIESHSDLPASSNEIGRLSIKDSGGKYHITVGGKYDNDDNAYFNIKKDAPKYTYLYKADGTHVCFLTLREDPLGGCNDPNEEGIDDDCFKDWVEHKKILTCDDKDKHPFNQALINKGYSGEFITALTGFYDAFQKAVNSQKGICRVKLNKYPGFFDGQQLNMIKTGNNLQLKAEGKGIVELGGEIQDYQPCIVDADKFTKWIKNRDQAVKDTQFINKDEVIIQGSGSGGIISTLPLTNHDPFKDNPVLYKAGTGHICVIPTYDDFLSNCGDAEGGNVDNDCLRAGKEFESNVEEC